MTRAGRVGVVVLDHEGPGAAVRAADSAQDATLDVRILIVENGSRTEGASRYERLRLAENRGFAGGMNAGIQSLLEVGCERLLLLNNDAVLEGDGLRQLTGALDDPRLGAVGPVVLREADGRVESSGVRIDQRSGRVRLVDHGQQPSVVTGLASAQALSGVVMMLQRAALERVGLLDESYFFSFEDLDWCLRARRAGFDLGIVRGARARHTGSATIGRSPSRLYYASRNHLEMLERLHPAQGMSHWLRRSGVLAMNVAHATMQRDVPRRQALAAVMAGFRDACHGRVGRRETVA